MYFTETTIDEFFRAVGTFEIPLYQRAYSWKPENLKVFLEDIVEQSDKENEGGYQG